MSSVEKTDKRTKVIYVLGSAYSGSTLMGLALNKHAQITNLGEVTNLESDYCDRARCTCQQTLKDCAFWTTVKQAIEADASSASFNLSARGKREYLDRRGGWEKIQLLLGRSLASTYSANYLKDYRTKNENFFTTVASAFPKSEYLVDLSKSAERLKVLLSSQRLDIWCIYLRRDPLKVYASTLKRPKRTRRFWGPKSLREAIWLKARTRDMEKTFSSVPAKRRITVDFVEFTTNPQAVLNGILTQLDLPPLDNKSAEAFLIHPSRQHIYVGNRWLFKPNLTDIPIRERSDTATLSPIQKLIFRSIWGSPKAFKT